MSIIGFISLWLMFCTEYLPLGLLRFPASLFCFRLRESLVLYYDPCLHVAAVVWAWLVEILVLYYDPCLHVAAAVWAWLVDSLFSFTASSL